MSNKASFKSAYLEFLVVKPPVLSVLEEVRVPVTVLKSVVHVIRDSLPVGDGLRVGTPHGGL